MKQIEQIEKALDLAQCEIRAMYKQLGYKDSNVLELIDEVLDQIKKFNMDEVIKKWELILQQDSDKDMTYGKDVLKEMLDDFKQ